MSAQPSTRSPRGCLTCKQRRKKCDETRPTCQRCKQGKFKCLGYTHLDSPQSSSKPWGSKSKNIPDTPLFSYEPIRLPSSNAQGLPPSFKASPAPTSRSQSSLDRPFEPPEPPKQRPQSVVSAVVPARVAAHQQFESIPRLLRFQSEGVQRSIQLVLSQLSRLGFRIFMSGRIQADAAIARRVHRSDMLRWTMYLGAQIVQMLLDRSGRKHYLDTICRFHRQIVSDTPLGLSSDLTTRLGASLDLANYAAMVSDSAVGYSLFRDATPLWYRFAAQFPLIRSGDSTVSLAYAICVPRFELSKFIFWDIIYTLTLGVPSILPYDTTYRPISARRSVLEWIYGCPLPLVLLIAKINVSRSAGTHLNPHDWQQVEMHLKQWTSKCSYMDKDSCRTVARLAIQESWRHAIYIYLYMGMCGVDSADPRVEASVQQIVRLSSTIEDTSPLGLHLFVPCLIAGAAARAEHHRAALRTRVHASQEVNLWIMRGADLAPVLDHLWHKAAREGRPVKWEDYIRSRRATLTINQ